MSGADISYFFVYSTCGVLSSLLGTDPENFNLGQNLMIRMKEQLPAIDDFDLLRFEVYVDSLIKIYKL